MRINKSSSYHWQRWLISTSLMVAVTPAGHAQTAALLAVQTYAGLTITGTVGSVYSIEYVTDLAQTNAWRCLEFLQLTASPSLWTDKSAPATGRRFYRIVSFATPANMVFIPPGSFRMGSPTNEVDRSVDEGPQTAVTLTKGFYIGKYLVTQRDYLALVGSNPSYFNTNNGFSFDLTRPVETVSWNGANNYCAKLTQQERAGGRIPTNCVYRLPTEAEWEYVCRAWISPRFYYGDDPGYTNLVNYAWYNGNSGGTTQPVGQKLPNAWGLYDVVGNAAVWCQDWYGPYRGGIATDPQGPASGSGRVVRGASWFADAFYCRSAQRFNNDPTGSYYAVGLRVVLAQGQP